MKPTTLSISLAWDRSISMHRGSEIAMVHLARSRTAFECGCPVESVRLLKNARSQLVHLRRTQTAALKNIDDAIASAKGGGK